MRIIPGFILREIAGETIAVPSGAAARRISGLVALNGSGKFLFELLQEEKTEAELVSALTEAYEVEEPLARADVAEFLALLREHNLLMNMPEQA